jgi:hypothetical protein
MLDERSTSATSTNASVSFRYDGSASAKATRQPITVRTAMPRAPVRERACSNPARAATIAIARSQSGRPHTIISAAARDG